MSQKIPFLQIDSAHRTSGTPSRFTVEMRPAIMNSRAVSLQAVNMPLTQYNLQASDGSRGIVGNNQFSFSIVTPLTPVTLAIPPGSYNSTTLITAFNLALANAGFPGITAAIDPLTFKVVITSTVPITLDFGSVPQDSIANILGFPNLDVPADTVFEAPNAFNFSVPPCIFIKIAELPTYVRSTTPGIGSVNVNYGRSVDGTFAIYPVSDSGSITFHFPMINWQTDIDAPNAHMSILNISLYDPRTGGLLDLHGSDWTMLLKFEYY